ncbi:hypothetical protein EXIGLDRAFT_758666 [Exidia glandulosa HHB12029]|uniref:Uncharacterized protein n=1 Tax=Exidia glandulosa HHB12029 TaxID=1314781 RepID=A0A165R1N5_EXIGL|nr:hypothetical protein EXIGLDRAFT_758666 [Exidia glandulosa HHB12029]
MAADIDKDTEDRTYVPGAHDTATSDSDSADPESSVTDSDLEANSTRNFTTSGADSGKVCVPGKLAVIYIQTPWSPPPTQTRLQVNSPGILIVWMIAMIVIASGLWASITAKAQISTPSTSTAGMTVHTPGIRNPANGLSQPIPQCEIKGHRPDAKLSPISAMGIMHGQNPEPND